MYERDDHVTNDACTYAYECAYTPGKGFLSGGGIPKRTRGDWHAHYVTARGFLTRGVERGTSISFGISTREIKKQMGLQRVMLMQLQDHKWLRLP
jgi:hypothetical protein